MPTKIRKSLFIGLGGTGMTSLLYTKKMFIDTYGEVPPMVAFLGIDTDGGWYGKSLRLRNGDEVSLDNNEQLRILVAENPRPLFKNYSDHLKWISPANLSSLQALTLGAGQVRSNGRFAITYNEVNVKNKIKQVYDQVSSITHLLNEKYEILGNEIEINLVFSLCGGTGSGIFINVAYLIKELYPQAKITGYAVLPDVFRTMGNGAAFARVRPNAYGSIQDLDYLMSLNVGSDPIRIDYLNRSLDVNEPPFSTFYFIDNKNEDNAIYDNVDNLAEMISLALVTATGELSQAAASVNDNVIKLIRDGVMDVENKKAWASGIGVCEIIYRGKELADIYALKAGQIIIERMLNSCADTNQIANVWIDQNRIRENNNKDDVIDFIATKQSKIPFSSIDDFANPKQECDGYINNVALPKSTEIDAKINELKQRVEPSLKELIVKEINTECGVDTVAGVLDDINEQITLCLGEMRHERDELEGRLTNATNALNSAISELQKCMETMFKRGKNERAESVVNATNNYATVRREIVRRDSAIIFYSWLQNLVNNYLQQVEEIRSQLKSVHNALKKKVSDIQFNAGRASQIFQIDLAQQFINTINVKQSDIVFTDFRNTINAADGVYGFRGQSTDDISRTILNFTKHLPGAADFRNSNIDAVMDKMDDDSLNHILDQAIIKSKPLFVYNYDGHLPASRPESFYYVGVPDKDVSVLAKDKRFESRIQGARQVQFASVGMNDRVIIYRQLGVVPAYAIAPVPSYRLEYDSCGVCCHWGIDFQRRLERERYNLYPQERRDDSVEMWVKGFVFGLIKKEVGRYMVKSMSLGDPIDNYWIDLGDGKYRDLAFDKFKDDISDYSKEFNDYIDDYQINNGLEETKRLILDRLANYWEVAQIGLTSAELRIHGMEAVRDLFRKELQEVEEIKRAIDE